MNQQQLSLTSEFIYPLTATRGIQGKHLFYIVNVPTSILVSLLRIDDAGSTMSRSQRTVNEKRAEEFSDYLIANLMKDSSFIIPPVTGFIDSENAAGRASFVSAADMCNLDNINVGFLGVGVLIVAGDAQFKLFDGQHRSRGVAIALQRILDDRNKYANIDLSQTTIPVMAYLDLTLEQRQMFFSDINMNMAKPQAAIGITYDHRDPLARFAVEIAQELPFKGLVELEKNTVSKKSDKLFSMKTVFDVIKAILRLGNKYTEDDITESHKAYVRNIINTFSRAMGWSALEFTGIAGEVRNETILTHTVMLKAMALAATVIEETYRDLKGVDLSPLSGLNYGRKDGDFIGRCIDPTSGNIWMNQVGIKLTASKLIQAVGLKLPFDIEQLERQYFPRQTKTVLLPEPEADTGTTEQRTPPAGKNHSSVLPDPEDDETLTADDVRTIVCNAMVDEKPQTTITRAVNSLLLTMKEYEDLQGRSLKPYLSYLKEEVATRRDNDHAGFAWKSVSSKQAQKKLIALTVQKALYGN